MTVDKALAGKREAAKRRVMLLEDLIASLERGLDQRPLTVTQVCIGVFYTAVQLSSGQVGVAFTPRDMEDTVCCPRSAAELPEAGQLSGKTALGPRTSSSLRFLSPTSFCWYGNP